LLEDIDERNPEVADPEEEEDRIFWLIFWIKQFQAIDIWEKD
jgi:hypothetical protein